jgi:FkbM family methyltransferase
VPFLSTPIARAGRLRRRVANALRATAELPDKRRALPRWALFELLRAATPLAAVERDGIRYLVRTSDRGVGRITYQTGAYEPELMEAALRHIGGAEALAGKVFVDVGANVGTTSIPAVRRFGAIRAVAFEPAQENFRLLSANVALNDLAERIAVRQVGVSDSAGTAALELAPHNSGDNRVRTAATSKAFDAYHENRRPTVEIELVRLDDALDALGVATSDVGLVWVDTQGHEGQVLAGAPGLLASRVPVVCEYWPYGLRRAGGLELFNAVVARSFARVIDARTGAETPADRVAELADRYTGERYSDLVLIPARSASAR